MNQENQVPRNTGENFQANAFDSDIKLKEYLVGAATLTGNDVFNNRADRLGEIKDLMLDIEHGTIRYAVLEVGGFFGIGARLFAIPWRALTLDSQRKCFIVEISKKRLRNAPYFENGHWPDMTDAAWESKVHEFYKSKLPQSIS